MFRRSLLLALAVLALAALAARQIDLPEGDGGGDDGGPVAAGPGIVERVLDGDTVIVAMDGYTGPVRIVGIDTPEIAHGEEPAACFGDEAAASATAWLLGRRVMVRPAREQRDRYGRLLARVEPSEGPIAGRDLAQVLALSGLARPLPISPNLDDAALIEEQAAIARRLGRGLWGACGEERAFPKRR